MNELIKWLAVAIIVLIVVVTFVIFGNNNIDVDINKDEMPNKACLEEQKQFNACVDILDQDSKEWVTEYNKCVAKYPGEVCQ